MSKNETSKFKKTAGESLSPVAQRIIYGIMLIAIIVLPGDFRMVAMLVVPIIGHYLCVALHATRKMVSSSEETKSSTKPVEEDVDIPQKSKNSIWQLVVLLTIVITIVVSFFQTEDFFMNLPIFPIIGLIAYAILTGQGRLIQKGPGKGPDPTKKGSTAWKKANGVEYVVGVGYRDKNGNYYDHNYLPIPTPVEVKDKKK